MYKLFTVHYDFSCQFTYIIGLRLWAYMYEYSSSLRSMSSLTLFKLASAPCSSHDWVHGEDHRGRRPGRWKLTQHGVLPCEGLLSCELLAIPTAASGILLNAYYRTCLTEISHFRRVTTRVDPCCSLCRTTHLQLPYLPPPPFSQMLYAKFSPLGFEICTGPTSHSLCPGTV